MMDNLYCELFYRTKVPFSSGKFTIFPVFFVLLALLQIVPEPVFSQPSFVESFSASAPILDLKQPFVIQVFLGETQVASFSINDLKKLSQVVASSPDAKRKLEGPTLLSILTLAKIKDFQEVTIFGLTQRRIGVGEITFKKDQITEKVFLGFNKRGTTKLVSQEYPLKVWLVDVTKMVIK